MATTPRFGITVDEQEDSPALQINEQGMRGTRRFKLAQADINSFCWELMGRHRVTGLMLGNGTSVPSVVYDVPANPFPGYPNLFCTEIDIKPFQGNSPQGNSSVDLSRLTNTYANGVLLTATYETTFDVNNSYRNTDLGGDVTLPAGTYITFTSELGGEIMSQPGRSFRWDGTSQALPADVNPGIVIPAEQFCINWRRVIAPPWAAIRGMLGKVNAAEFMGYPPGCMLFQGCVPRPLHRFQHYGVTWALEYRFSGQTKTSTVPASTSVYGWNYLYKEVAIAGEHWVQIEDQDGNPPHREGDFKTLFAYGR